MPLRSLPSLWPLLAVLVVTRVSLAADPFRLEQNEVVAFLGGTNCINMQKAGYFEATLTLKHAKLKPRFVDMAWEADTVFRQGTVIERWRKDKFGDLSEQLRLHRTTTVFLMFGQHEALTGYVGLENFAQAHNQLCELCREDDRQVVVVSPIRFEVANSLLPDLASRNHDLANYVAEMKKISEQQGCQFVDLFHVEDSRALTDNGMHIIPAKQSLFTEHLLCGLRLDPHVATEADCSLLRLLISQKHKLWTNYWRPANWKCLYGDDGERNFGKSTGGSLTLREEWKRLPKMISEAEEEIWKAATAMQGRRER